MNNLILHKILILLIKYIPIIQLIGMFINDIMYFTDNYELAYITDYMFGNSIIFVALILLCSYVFHFCTCYRMIILCNFINSTIGFIDRLIGVPIDNLNLFVLHCIIIFIFILIINYLHLKDKL